MEFQLNAQLRTMQGSGASRRLRRADKIPAIIYGGTAAPEMIELGHNQTLVNLRKEAFHSSIITIDIAGATQQVLLRNVQMHAYKPLVLHIDFQRVEAGHKLHQKVPLHFINAELAPGVKLGGGIVSHVLNELDISCLPKDLPEFIEVDLQAMTAGQSLHVSQLQMPAGVTPVSHGSDDPVVVSIVIPQKAASSEETPAA